MPRLRRRNLAPLDPGARAQSDDDDDEEEEEDHHEQCDGESLRGAMMSLAHPASGALLIMLP